MFSIGDVVRIKNSNLCGNITNIKVNKKETLYYVNIDNKNILLNSNKLEKVNKRTNIINRSKKKDNISMYDSNYKSTFIPEITIRHQTLDIAMYNVENFINDAIQNNIKDLKIIHGRNGGVLRKAVHEYLKHNKNIKSFRLGNYYEGSYGVTIIKLK